jgi:hypothetical protein
MVPSRPFQQWSLDFIGEIHPTSSGRHRWILTTTYYFTKWIEAIPTRSVSHKVIISFLEDIMERFGCLNRIITNNTASFKVEPLIQFFEQFKISLIHSTHYYPQGNRLADSSNNNMINIIKRILEEKYKAWNSKLKFTLWTDRVTTKRSLGISHIHLVYRVKEVFPSQLTLPMEKFFQDCQGEPDDMIRRIL